jgi:hypothetical protein
MASMPLMKNVYVVVIVVRGMPLMKKVYVVIIVVRSGCH